MTTVSFLVQNPELGQVSGLCPTANDHWLFPVQCLRGLSTQEGFSWFSCSSLRASTSTSGVGSLSPPILSQCQITSASHSWKVTNMGKSFYWFACFSCRLRQVLHTCTTDSSLPCLLPCSQFFFVSSRWRPMDKVSKQTLLVSGTPKNAKLLH